MTEIPIRGYHLDFYQHVNNARYLEFLEEARWEYFSKIFEADYFEKKGLGFVIVNININFKQPAVLGDIASIECAIKNVGNKSVTMYQKITDKNTGKFIADADVTFVLLELKTFKPQVINEELKSYFNK